MKSLTKEKQELYANTNICKEKFENKYLKDKNIVKLEIIVIIQGNTGAVDSIYNLKYSVPKNIWIVSHNGSNYDYHFVKKELEEEFKKILVQEKTLTNTQPLQFQQKKKLQELTKMEKKIQKIYLLYYNLLITPGL